MGSDHVYNTPLELMKLDYGTRFIPGAHFELIDDYLMKLLKGEIKRLAVFLPPRHGKSELISKYFPAFIMGTELHKNIIQTSYAKTLAENFTRASRDVVDYYGLYDLKQDLKRADEYMLDRPGTSHVLSRGVGGGITGHGADIIIMDDLIKDSEQAMSPIYKRKLIDWYSGTLSSRLEPNGIMLLVTTRWSEDDIGAHILKENDKEDNTEKWTVLNLPAICTEPENDLLGREFGDALWPERWPIKSLLEKKQLLGTYWFESEYQGNPVPLTGEIMNPDLFGNFSRTPNTRDNKSRIMSVDLAISTSPRADETVITILDFDQNNFYVQKQFCGRWDSNTSTEEIAKKYNYYHPDALYIETVGFQKVIVDNLINLGIPVQRFEDNRPKEVKLMELIPILEQGRIYLNTTEDWELLKHQLRAFPRGQHDDRIDSLWMGVSKSGGGNPYTKSDKSYDYSERAIQTKGRPKSVFVDRNPYSASQNIDKRTTRWKRKR